MIDPTKPIEVVHPKDPALDPAMDWAEYLRTRDPALIKESPARRAVRFILRPLAGTAREDIDDRYPSQSARQRAAFQCAIQEVRYHDKVEPVPAVSVGSGDGTYRCCTAEYYSEFKAKWGLNFIYYLGQIVYGLAGDASADPFLASR